MKTQLASIALGLSLVTSVAACGSDSGLTDGIAVDAPTSVDSPPSIDAPPGVTMVEVAGGDVSTDQHWTADHIYLLQAYYFQTGGTLTIDAGTEVRGKMGSAITITKDAKIDAVGTAAKPIVFTSANPTPAAGDWGGVILEGKAPINVVGGTNKIEGFPDTLGEKIVYGSATPNPAHDCGKINYARIEYAGFLLSPDNELNGLTMGGCGSATSIDHVQVHLGQDDGVEIFGGTVNVSHLVISQPDDDGLDWDLGWSGKAQFVIVQQKPGRGDKGIEADNNRNNNELAPRSAPELWNVTLIGGNGGDADPQGGMHLRRGTAGKINNAIVGYFGHYAVNVDGASTVAQFNAGALAVKNTYFVKSDTDSALWPTGFDVPASGVEDDGGFNEAATIGGDATNHMNVDVKLPDARNLTAPSFKPMAGSPVLTGCGTPPAGFDTTATFCGAIGATDWTAGWTRFPL